MGVRTRLKKMVKKLFFASNTNVTMKSTPNENSKTEQSTQSTTTTTETSNPEPLQSKKEHVTQDEQKVETDSKQEQKEDKVLRHRRRAKLGLLRFVSEREGVVDLATLHTHSEMKYFIGHKSFSDLMEEMVEEEFLDFDWENSVAHLTEKGRLETQK